MVVHGQPEEDGEQDEREPRLYRLDLLEPEQVSAYALLEHEHHQPVGGADREQVHDDRLDGNDDGAEDHQEQDEAHAEDEREDDGQVGAELCVEVQELR